jgi:hypothetical protein
VGFDSVEELTPGCGLGISNPRASKADFIATVESYEVVMSWFPTPTDDEIAVMKEARALINAMGGSASTDAFEAACVYEQAGETEKAAYMHRVSDMILKLQGG